MIQVLEFVPGGNGCVKGKLKIIINESQVMSELTVCENEKSRWVSFPSHRITIDGKDHWRPYVQYLNPTIQRKFCEEIIKAFDAHMVK